MSESELLDRKAVARLLGQSVDFVRRHEEQLGLGPARVYLGKRAVRYRRDILMTLPLFRTTPRR